MGLFGRIPDRRCSAVRRFMHGVSKTRSNETEYRRE
jgi:hypothetical protein